jgi:hypothetical protein
MYKLHGLTFVGLVVAGLVNDVTNVVNCYGVVSPSPECCKCDLSDYYCEDITLEFKYWNYFFCGTGRFCTLCTDSLLNSAVPYCEQNYDTIMLVVLLICKIFR